MLQVNGISVTFTSCDTSGNSYIALFVNPQENPASGNAFSNTYPVCDNFFKALQINPSRRRMPVEYFTFAEMNWGGACGCYSQTDGRPGSQGIVDVAIGFR